MEDWSVLDLARDPVPGDPARIQTLAARLLREAEYAEQHASRLGQVAANSIDLRMQGDYAPLFQQRLARLPQQAAGLGPAQESCGRALIAYVQTLEQAKIQSRAALSRGMQADAQYKAALQQFCTLAPGFSYTGSWRELDESFALRCTQYQRPEVRAAAARIGAYAAQAERERQAAATMARQMARVAAEAETRCAQAIRAAIPALGATAAASGRNGLADTTPLLLRPPSLRPDLVELGPAARNAERTPCVGEPIDVATGAMLMTQTDLTLPGSLPLQFTRTHLSSYRGGVRFGLTWISTLDECLQIDGEGVVFAAADGMRLVYPVPQPGVPTMPAKGPRWPLEWDGKPDGATTVTDPSTGVTRTFAAPVPSPSFGVFHLALDSWSDRNGNRIDVERDDDGIPFGIRHSGGYYVAVDTQGPRITALRLLDEPPSRYRPSSAPDEGTVVMRYGYDTAGNLTEIVNSSDKPLRFAYDTEGRVTRWTDRNGTWFSYVYDDRGRVTRTEGIDGILSGTLTYEDTTRTTTYTDSQGHTSVHRYNAEGQVVEETNPLGLVTRTEWDEYGSKPLAVTDQLGHTTRYTYDDTGNLTGVLLPDGTQAQARYNALGLPTEVIEPGGAFWQHMYDERGNRLVTVDPLGAETRYAYDDAGRPTAVTNALGQTRTVTCDAAGMPLALTDELGHTTTVRRDSFGRVIEVTDPLGNTTRVGWTTEGKPAWRELTDGTRESWTWDAEGNLLCHTDLAGKATHHSVSHFGVPVTSTEPGGARYTFDYDTELRLTAVTNPQGLTWSYTYDDAGRLTAETDFNGRTLTYTRDAAGNLTARTNGVGQSLRFVRDPLGRVVEQRTDTDDVTAFVYGPDGNLCRAVNADAELALERDPLGRVLSETVNGRTATYVLDAVGHRTRRTTPSGLISEWTYDLAGHPLTLRSSVGALDFSHDAVGRETQRNLGTEVSLTQTWTAAGLLSAQTLTASSPDRLLQHRTYAHRADGYLTETRELTSGTRRFVLDDMGRVTRMRAHGWSETYAYASAGHLTHAESPAHGASGGRRFEGTLVRAAGRTSYEHDGEGRLVRRTRKLLNGQTRTWTYRWNAEDRLTDVITPHGTQWRYAYDPLGRRICKHRVADDGSAADRTVFVWDDLCLAEQVTADGWVTTWDYAPDSPRPVAQTRHKPSSAAADTSFLAQLAEESDPESGTRFHAVVTDSIGTPTELVSATGDLVWQRRTSLWGTPLPALDEATPPVDCPLRFPGQYADLESGLHYNLYRYYDPETARYISADPLGLVRAPDHHAYVANPLGWSDHLGLAGKGPTGPKNPLEFGQGYTGRRDPFPVGNKGRDVEIHVYDKSMREVGLYNSQGWFNKHGIEASDVEVPPGVENAIKGRMIYELRKVGRIGPKGTEDITGDKWRRPPLAAEGCK